MDGDHCLELRGHSFDLGIDLKHVGSLEQLGAIRDVIRLNMTAMAFVTVLMEGVTMSE